MSGKRDRSNERTMPDPLAFFLTWPTYGTWLPGDERGWVEYHRGWQLPDPPARLEAAAIMREGACILDRAQRAVVEKTIADHCRKRGWQLYAVNCRTNHLHIVVAAHDNPDRMRVQFKAWCTRRLKELETQRGKNPRANWWAERGSRRYINDESSLAAAIAYVTDGQDKH
jgi:REP element-mobilizing transposase RayT